MDEIVHNPVEELVDFFFVVTAPVGRAEPRDPDPVDYLADARRDVRVRSGPAYPVRHLVRGKVTARTSAGEGGSPPRSAARTPSRKESTSAMRYPGKPLAS